MRLFPLLLRLGPLVSLALLVVSCATPPAGAVQSSPGPGPPYAKSTARSTAEAPERLRHAPEGSGALGASSPPPQVLPVGIREMGDGQVKLLLPLRPPSPSLGIMAIEEARSLLGALTQVRVAPEPRLRLLEVSSERYQQRPPNWQLRVREELLAGFGPGMFPLPNSDEGSPLWAALKMSPRFMGEGVRQAAEELFNSPLFVHSVYLSVMLYFSAWVMPEPLFSKALAATLTVRLAMLVGLVELTRVAQACVRLYREVQEARTPQQLEAASARFGVTLGGVGFRVVVLVATMGVGRLLPEVPRGGIVGAVRSWAAVMEAGPSVGMVSTAQVVADGTLVVTGTLPGLAVSSACASMGLCATASSTGRGPQALSTRYGPPHTRKNPPHNEAIEEELAAREHAGHSSLDKNKAQLDAAGERALDTKPVRGVRFRRPDASSVRPDGVRHNTNYVSNPKDLKRELEAFEALIRADHKAIHELYMLNGTLVRRYVPPGVQYP